VANDDVAVATVEIAIFDRPSGLWWQPGDGTWGASTKDRNARLARGTVDDVVRVVDERAVRRLLSSLGARDQHIGEREPLPSTRSQVS
jgi:hypothetical protein